MPQVAVFVDAGDLYAQGSTLLEGKRLDRDSIRLSEKEALDQLAETARTVASGARLLRIYWYDGVLINNRPSLEQDLIGQSANTKLRLGLINSRGQQKGVDSLIVTDLIELARNRAITDALILSGDEDIKIGVQVAQTFGVRIHLLGIKPARGSQSDGLMMEADTCHEWDEAVVGRWMRCDDTAADCPVQSASVTPETDSLLAADRRPLSERAPFDLRHIPGNRSRRGETFDRDTFRFRSGETCAIHRHQPGAHPFRYRSPNSCRSSSSPRPRSDEQRTQG